MADIETARLLVRQWRDDDRRLFAALNADPVVMEHFPAVLTTAESDAFVDRQASLIDERGWGLWAVEIRESGAFAGFVGLSVPRFDAPFMPAVEVGWRLRREAWGSGYASEAARGVLRYGFRALDLDGVVSFTIPANVRSRAVMERIGMTHDAADDFAHPLLPPASPFSRHMLYRLRPSRLC